jgi:hypothetical protein
MSTCRCTKKRRIARHGTKKRLFVAAVRQTLGTAAVGLSKPPELGCSGGAFNACPCGDLHPDAAAVDDGYLGVTARDAAPPRLLRTVMFCGFEGQQS